MKKSVQVAVLALALSGISGVARAQFYTTPAPASSGAAWGTGSATAALGSGSRTANDNGYCDDQIAQAQAVARQQEIEDRTLLARELYSDMPSGGFFGAACMSNLFSQGLSILFQPPNFAALRDQLLNAACNAVSSYVSQARQATIGRATSMISNTANGSLPLGNIIPGVNLGSLGGGVDFGGNYGGGVQSNMYDVIRQADGGYGVQDYLSGRRTTGYRVGNSVFVR